MWYTKEIHCSVSVSEKCSGAEIEPKFHDKPVAVWSGEFISKKKDISIGSASGGIEIATVSVATPSLSRNVTVV